MIQNPSSFQVDVVHAHTSGDCAAEFLQGERPACFLSLSPNTKYVSYGRISAMLQWVLEYSDQIMVIEGTHGTRWDGLAQHRLSPEQVLRRVAEEDARVQRRIKTVIQNLGASAKVQSLSWADLLRDPGMVGIQGALREYAAGSAQFLDGVRQVVDGYLARKYRGQWQPEPADYALLENYVYEELAIFLRLYQWGYRLEVYPGSDLAVMRAIVEGCFSDFPFSLAGRAHLSIELKENVSEYAAFLHH